MQEVHSWLLQSATTLARDAGSGVVVVGGERPNGGGHMDATHMIPLAPWSLVMAVYQRDRTVASTPSYVVGSSVADKH